MTVYDQAHELEENLPSFLTQEYEAGYEMVVVDETSTDNTDDVLKLLKSDYPHLYTTFLPKPDRLVTRRRLGLSIGVKASKYEWVIITKCINKPSNSEMLEAFSQNIEEDAELTLGYILKKGILLQPFTSVSDASCHLRKSERKLKKVRQRRWMKYILGRYDFIIVKKELAHEMLKFFEQKIPSTKVNGIRMSIVWHNLCHRSSNILLISG